MQSFPVNAISLAEALDDLRRNAADGDVVLLQEIAARYKTLVQMAFPASEWVVYYGRSDNSTPIAFRRALFSKVEGRVELLHPAVKHLHFRRYMTHLRLRARDLRFEFHVTNLHLVAGAFNGVDEPDQDLRLEEWNDGIAKHQRLVESLVDTGLPVVGGGDYNRQLERFKSLGSEIAGKQVTYAVDGASIDLLWFIDGDESGWGVRSTKVFPGRRSKAPQRNSDHGMRRATVTLTGTPATAPVGPTVPKATTPEARCEAGTQARTEAGRTPKASRPEAPDHGAGAAARGGPHARPVRADHLRRRHPQARRLEDPRRARGGAGPAGLPAHRRAGLLQPGRLGLGRHPRRRRGGRPARLGLAAQGQGAAEGRLRGVVPRPGPRPLGPAHPRRPDRPRQARAGRRPAGDRLPQRA